MIADMAIQTEAARSLVYRSAAMVDEGVTGNELAQAAAIIVGGIDTSALENALADAKADNVKLQQKLKAFSDAEGFGKDEIIARMDKLIDFASDRDMLNSSPADVLKAFADDPDYDPLVGQNLRAEDELGTDLRECSILRLASASYGQF